MTKKILLAIISMAFAFSGCAQQATAPKPPAVDKVVKATSKAVKVTKKETKSSAESALPQSSMKDQVIDEAVDVADKKTDGAATKIIESVK